MCGVCVCGVCVIGVCGVWGVCGASLTPVFDIVYILIALPVPMPSQVYFVVVWGLFFPLFF